uniref:Uncharacterized protein n=1 Tax=Arundo donax TaxID=35708 RepID=A0A0A9H0E9_ARUDO
MALPTGREFDSLFSQKKFLIGCFQCYTRNQCGCLTELYT